MKAIPTKYRGYQMRSRLEARWAAFFDQIGWQWEYEPYDLNGWIPDFLIYGQSPLLVEVKPAQSCGELTTLIERAHHRPEAVLLVGVSPFLDGAYAGVLGEPEDRDPSRAPSPHFAPAFWAQAYGRGPIGVYRPEKSRVLRPCGYDFSVGKIASDDQYDALSLCVWQDNPEPDAAWAAACNDTQWRRPA